MTGLSLMPLAYFRSADFHAGRSYWHTGTARVPEESITHPIKARTLGLLFGSNRVQRRRDCKDRFALIALLAARRFSCSGGSKKARAALEV